MLSVVIPIPIPVLWVSWSWTEGFHLVYTADFISKAWFFGSHMRAIMAMDISSCVNPHAAHDDMLVKDSKKVWYWQESVAWEMLQKLETQWTDAQLDDYWSKEDSDNEEDCSGRRIPSKVAFFPELLLSTVLSCVANNNTSKQRGLLTTNTQTSSLPVCEEASMLSILKTKKSNVFPVTSMTVPLDKGQWHIYFWGNDYTAIDSFPAKPPIFYPCLQSLKHYKLIFTNVREKKDAYTGKVQDWDFRLGTEIFDVIVRQQNNGKTFTQESWERVLSFAERYKKKSIV
eukprot:g54993.t1